MHFSLQSYYFPHVISAILPHEKEHGKCVGPSRYIDEAHASLLQTFFIFLNMHALSRICVQNTNTLAMHCTHTNFKGFCCGYLFLRGDILKNTGPRFIKLRLLLS